MRKKITLFDDQYAFYKELKSEKLLIAFVEYMFDDIEPQWFDSKIEEITRNSLLPRMDKLKAKIDAWSEWWKNSHWWGAKEWNQNAKKTTSKITTKQQAKNKQDKDKDKDNKIKKEVEDNKKNKYLDFVYLSEEEHQKLTTQLWPKLTDQLIEKLNNYIWSIWKDKYKSHYYTILNRSKNEAGATTHSLDEERRERERQRIREEAQAILSHKQNENGKSIQNEWVNRRTSIAGC